LTASTPAQAGRGYVYPGNGRNMAGYVFIVQRQAL
jgi:hypothetical protein